MSKTPEMTVSPPESAPNPPQMIFVNMPVKDLPRSMQFFQSLGYGFNAQFTNDQAACMVISDTIYVMLLTEAFFKSFTAKALCDTETATEMLVCLSSPSRASVDEMVGKAVMAGAKCPKAPMDFGFMYQRAFEDLDGHIWEVIWMDPAHVQQQNAADAAP